MSSNDEQVIRCSDKIKYIYQLPFFERRELCRILNQNDKWEELAGVWMEYDVMTVQSLWKEKNPTDELLTMWGHHNHTILELFVLLSKMQHYQAMVPLQTFVDQKFHKLLYHGESNLNRVLEKRLKNTKDLKIGMQNFNQLGPSDSNVPKIVIEGHTKENSYKILNKPMQAIHIGDPPSNSNNLLVASVTPAHLLPPSLQNTVPNTISNKKNDNEGVVLQTDATLPHATYNELNTATNGWNNVLGKGGFGTVYKGIWKNTDVAIKKLEKKDSTESYAIELQQSLREIKILNSFPHENILSLYAYSLDGPAPCLVYQLMGNGSLEDRLLVKGKSQPLIWLQRHHIAVGTARGLQYLHTIGKKPLIHGDIKSANILLDKNFEPKIGDFGLAREGLEGEDMKVSKIHGTRPYLPQEFLFERKLSTKIDTYSYGIVLFELATGLRAYDRSRVEKKFLKDFINSWEDANLHLLIDKKAGEKDKQVFHNLMILGKWCTNIVQNRPEMDLVFKKLKDLE